MSHPNIILAVGRQHRHDCVGYAGHPAVKTPNLDALAAGGAWFADARAAKDEPHAALEVFAAPAVLERLRAAGYRLGYAGPPHPALDAFHTARTAPLPGPDSTPTNYHHWLAEHGYADQATEWGGDGIGRAPSSYRAHFGAVRSVLPESAHPTAWLGDQAVGFVRSALEPFCLVVCFTRPGEPHDPPAMREQTYPAATLPLPAGCQLPVDPADAAHCPRFDFSGMTSAALRHVLAHYYASITLVDQQVGRILATLQARGLTRNLIAYTALGGELAGHRGLMGAGAPEAFSILSRVPMIVGGAPGLAHGRHEAPFETRLLPERLVQTALNDAWPGENAS